MQFLTQRLTDREDFTEAIQAVSNQQGVSVDGVWGSSCALVAAGICSGIQQQPPVNLIVLAHDKMIDDFRDDLLLFSDRRSVHFPVVNSG